MLNLQCRGRGEQPCGAYGDLPWPDGLDLSKPVKVLRYPTCNSSLHVDGVHASNRPHVDESSVLCIGEEPGYDGDLAYDRIEYMGLYV